MSRLLLGVAFLAIAIWLLIPRPPRFGNPRHEQLVSGCFLANSGAIVRLYEGRGDATVSIWYSVTYQKSPAQQERQFFFTDSWPTIDLINCQEFSLELEFDDGSARSLSQSQVEELTTAPIGLIHGEDGPAPVQPQRAFSLILGWVMFAVGGLVVRPLVRRSAARCIIERNLASDTSTDRDTAGPSAR